MNNISFPKNIQSPAVGLKMKVSINGQQRSSHYDGGYGIEVIQVRGVVLIASLQETLARPNRGWKPLCPRVIVYETDLPVRINVGPHRVEID